MNSRKTNAFIDTWLQGQVLKIFSFMTSKHFALNSYILLKSLNMMVKVSSNLTKCGIILFDLNYMGILEE